MRNIFMDKYSIVVYACLGSIIIWVFLKAFGIINTPTIFELFPLLAGALASGAAYGKFATTLRHIERKTNQIPSVKDRLTKIETTCELTHKRKIK